MDQKNSVKLLDNTFNHDFDLDRFSVFIKELFNHFNLRINKNIPLRKEYYEYIKRMDSLGVYSDPNGDSIEVFVVQLEKSSSRDRARTMQRNLIAKYLKNSGSNAALVAFYGDDPEDWRFSFVKIEYDLIKDEKGNLRVKEEITPARRYSFLVGVNEPNHTCRKQFLSLIKEENADPILEQIEDAFSIENVTKEFFEVYQKLFLKLQESLEEVIKRDEIVRNEFHDKLIPTADFAKKLMGQIVFIYFLQKKGWLGVDKGDEWGSGPRNFLRKLFNREMGNYVNFFNDILEPLFYEALATPRDGDYYRHFDCRIPFLNGGLFEPINNYDWIKTEITLENKIFEEIFEVFDLYNFTIKEDEPLEKEVAVDPEMLGKVFENLLEVKDRKSKGAFYTPREIVHYMCQESLINYLETKTAISREDLEEFIHFGDFALDLLVREIIEYGELKEDREYGLPTSIKENNVELDDFLRNIKIIDPAVGSGAFPVGMMNEIVKARSILSLLSGENKQHYELKLETIRESLYGVDLDSSAVDIAKLRFWLSLIVDEQDIGSIDPLPNLDHKIMCGNSLIEDFDGKKLFDDDLISKIPIDHSNEIKQLKKRKESLYNELGNIHTGKIKDKSKKINYEKEIKKIDKKIKEFKSTDEDNSLQFTLDDNYHTRRIKESQLKLKELKKLHKLFFKEQNTKVKKKHRLEIEKIEWEFIEETLREEGNEAEIEKLNQYKLNQYKPFFIWKLYFPEVFHRDNPGFDIVIANPPYVEFKNLDKNTKNILEKHYETTKGKYDLYIPFLERTEYLSRKNGFITFICPTRFLHRDYGKNIRKFLTQRFYINEIIDFGDNQVFEGATNYTGIFSFINTKQRSDELLYYKRLKTNNLPPKTNFISMLFQNSSTQFIEVIETINNTLTEDVWYFHSPKIANLFNKMKSISETLNNLSEGIFQGIATGKDPVFIIDEKKVDSYNIEKNVVYPILKGKDISPYTIKWKNKYVIYPYDDLGEVINEETLKNDFKNVYNYLAENKEKLKGRAYFEKSNKNWYELWNQRKLQRFKQTKIITLDNAKQNSFALDTEGFVGTTTVYSIILKSKTLEDYLYTIAILNSNLLNFFHKKNTIPQRGGFYRYQALFIKNLPIKMDSGKYRDIIIDLVRRLIELKNNGDLQEEDEKEINNKLNNIIYDLYQLTTEEKDIVNNSI